MKVKLFALFLVLSQLEAVDFRIGSGTFDWEMGIENFMKCDFDLDINTISITETHANFGDNKLYYFYNADIYSSDFVDKMTTLMATPITHDFPIFGSVEDAIERYTPIPTPSSYKIRGFDLNLGIGYDFYREKNNFVGIGINTGLSLPVMKMKDLKQSAEFTKKILDATKTTIKTYKLGPSLTGGFEVLPNLSAYGTFGFGLQKGSLENDWIRSSMDVDGGYSVLDFGVNYSPLPQYPKLHITLGYSKKSWSVDKGKVDMFNVFDKEVFRMLSTDFSSSSAYLGVGYKF